MAQKKKAKKSKSLSELSGSPKARQLAIGILQALSGLKGTTEVCEDLGISQARYYQLEHRALSAMLASLEPRERGRQASEGKRIETLLREKERLSRELRRYQSLARVGRRGLALAPARGKKAAKKKRVRRGERGKRVLKTLSAGLHGGQGDGPTDQDDPRPGGRTGPAEA